MLLFLSLTAYRVHSIFVLRMFNDPVAICIMYLSINLLLDHHWKLACLCYRLAVCVCMCMHVCVCIYVCVCGMHVCAHMCFICTCACTVHGCVLACVTCVTVCVLCSMFACLGMCICVCVSLVGAAIKL